jgi:hypothetical protein
MDRRELLKLIATITGSALVGGELFLSGCRSGDAASADFFNEQDISFFDEVAETILPGTNTPGAKEAAVGQFMASYSTDCYNEIQRKTLKEGINRLNEASEKMNNSSFVEATAIQKQNLLVMIDAEAKKYNADITAKPGVERAPHYFTLMKQLVLFGFFTSKAGITKVLRYRPVPGKYEGCIDYTEGETSWA